MNRDKVKDFVLLMHETEDFETFLERFDITIDKAFVCLFDSGLIDEVDLRELMRFESDGPGE